jgi:ribosomal protein RSM22 (predicted rRNA methylase)
VTLPQALQTGIDELVSRTDRRRIERAAQRLSDAYRSGGPGAARAARSSDDVAAYLATRAPATYAAAAAVFGHVQAVRPGWTPASLLDLGAGPGIASWAAVAAWPGITRVDLVEAEPEMVSAGRALAATGAPPLRTATWAQADAVSAEVSPAQLVIASYVLGELPTPAVEILGRKAWAASADTLVIVEPGTTAGYERVLGVRAEVLESGGATLAPCPHDDSCPLPAGDWCHFAVRLPRSKTHRSVKGAERGFEDEKVAYAALTHAEVQTPSCRIIRRPELNPGHVVLTLCTSTGLERRTIARREKDAYRDARKRAWGDSLP